MIFSATFQWLNQLFGFKSIAWNVFHLKYTWVEIRTWQCSIMKFSEKLEASSNSLKNCKCVQVRIIFSKIHSNQRKLSCRNSFQANSVNFHPGFISRIKIFLNNSLQWICFRFQFACFRQNDAPYEIKPVSFFTRWIKSPGNGQKSSRTQAVNFAFLARDTPREG